MKVTMWVGFIFCQLIGDYLLYTHMKSVVYISAIKIKCRVVSVSCVSNMIFKMKIDFPVPPSEMVDVFQACKIRSLTKGAKLNSLLGKDEITKLTCFMYYKVFFPVNYF